MGQFAGLVMLPLAIIPMAAAFIAHRLTGAIGNPFRGLQWGHGAWFIGLWGLGLVAGLVVAAVSIGLSLQGFDPEMGDFVRYAAEQSAEQGNAIPESQLGMLKIGGWVTALGSPTVGVWILAAFLCLSTFPWLGWFGRRMLVHGRQAAVIALVVLFGVTGAAGGLLENPQMGEASLLLRVALVGLLGASSAPALLWLLLKTRSAVLPAVANASYTMGLAATMPFLAGGNPVLTPPQGLLVSAVALGIGIALWIWKDPGGAELAVAGVAHDGTPLTPEALKRLENEEASPTIQPLTVPPATPRPSEIEGDTQERAVAVSEVRISFLRVAERGCRPSGFVGTGTLEFTEKDLILRGKKPMSTAFQVTVFLALCLVGFAIGVGVGIGAVILAVLIDIFARRNHVLMVPASSVISVVKDQGSTRFALVATTGEAKPECVHLEVASGFALIAQAMEQRYPSLIRDGKVKGQRTF